MDSRLSLCKCVQHSPHPLTGNEQAHLSMAKAFWTGGELSNAHRLFRSLLAPNSDDSGSARNGSINFEVQLEMTTLLVDMGRV